MTDCPQLQEEQQAELQMNIKANEDAEDECIAEDAVNMLQFHMQQTVGSE